MGLGGQSGGGSTQTVVQQQQIPQYLQDFTQENMNVARDISARPFPTYGGQRIADLDPAQRTAYDVIGNAATGPWATQANAANSNAQNVASGFAQNGSGFQPFNNWAPNPNSMLQIDGQYNPQMYGQTLDPNAVAPWMSPYVEQALQPQLRAIQRQSDQTRLGLNAGATAAGAFGDSRLGVQQGENDRNTANLMSDVTGQGYQSAYDRAVAASQNAFGQNAGAFFQNQANRLSGWQANAGQMNAENEALLNSIRTNLGINQQNNQGALANSQFQLGAAQSIPQMLAAQYGLTEQQAQDLMSSGQMSQQFNQQGLSTAYQDFLNQFEYPQEMLNLRLATTQNQPYSSTRLTTTPYSQTAQSIGGLAALMGLGGRSGLFGSSA